MSAAALVSRTHFIPNGSCCSGLPENSAGRSNGSRTAPRILLAPRKAGTIAPAHGLLWMPTAAFSPHVSTIANLGAYMSGGGPGSSTNAPANAMGGGYVIPAISMDVQAAFTNTVPIDAYRGAGKPEANYLMERLIDLAARRHGFDPPDLRRRNMITSFPYAKALGTVVDGGRFAANIDDVVDWRPRGFPGSPRRIRAARQAAWTRPVPASWKPRAAHPTKARKSVSTAMVRWNCWSARNRTARGTRPPIRKSPPTCLACRRPFRYIQGDTGQVRAGNGHGGARSMHMGGAAMFRAGQRGDCQRHAPRAAAGRTAAGVCPKGFASLPARFVLVDLLAVRPRAIRQRREDVGSTPMSGTC